jgi:hypothetical protein
MMFPEPNGLEFLSGGMPNWGVFGYAEPAPTLGHSLDSLRLGRETGGGKQERDLFVYEDRKSVV